MGLLCTITLGHKLCECVCVIYTMWNTSEHETFYIFCPTDILHTLRISFKYGTNHIWWREMGHSFKEIQRPKNFSFEVVAVLLLLWSSECSKVVFTEYFIQVVALFRLWLMMDGVSEKWFSYRKYWCRMCFTRSGEIFKAVQISVIYLIFECLILFHRLTWPFWFIRLTLHS